jgi:hypothetical protein
VLQQGLEVWVLLGIAFTDPIEPVEIGRGDRLRTATQVAGQHQDLIVHRQGPGPMVQGALKSKRNRSAQQLQQHQQFDQLAPLLRIRQGLRHPLGLGWLQTFKIHLHTQQTLEQDFEQLRLGGTGPATVPAPGCCESGTLAGCRRDQPSSAQQAANAAAGSAAAVIGRPITS